MRGQVRERKQVTDADIRRTTTYHHLTYTMGQMNKGKASMSKPVKDLEGKITEIKQ